MRFKLSGASSVLFYIDLPETPNFTVTARVSGPLSEAGLRRALERLPERHPMLQVHGLIAEDGAAYFTTDDAPPVPLRIGERHGPDDWVEQVKVELQRPFVYLVGPLFRLVWLRGADVSDLILVCDHITADALAGIYALRTLLELLADPERGLEMEPPPPLADRLPQSVRDRAAALNALPPPPAPPEPAGPPPSLALPPICLLPIELTEAETTALVARCRAEGVSVQAALTAAFLFPAIEQRPDTPVGRVEVPVDLRNRVSRPIGEAYGAYISLMVVEVNYPAGSGLWEFACEANRALTEAMNEERYYHAPILMVMIADRFPPGDPFATDYDISISNLGRLNIPPDYGPYRLDSIYAPTMIVQGPEHRILGVNTFNGQLRATFISRDPLTLTTLRGPGNCWLR